MRHFPKASVILAGAALLCWRGLALAQLPGGVACPPGSPCDVYDAGDMGPADIFYQLLQQDTITAQSVTTPLPSLPYTPIPSSFYANIANILSGGVNNSSFCINCPTDSADFIGWVKYLIGWGTNSTAQAQKTVTDMLTTAQSAIEATSALSGTQVDTAGIAQAATSTNSLFGLLQIEVATQLADIDEHHLDRLQHAAQTRVEAARMAEDINTRAQERAQSAATWWGME